MEKHEIMTIMLIYNEMTCKYMYIYKMYIFIQNNTVSKGYLDEPTSLLELLQLSFQLFLRPWF